MDIACMKTMVWYRQLYIFIYLYIYIYIYICGYCMLENYGMASAAICIVVNAMRGYISQTRVHNNICKHILNIYATTYVKNMIHTICKRRRIFP